jgi:hypothetical protein
LLGEYAFTQKAPTGEWLVVFAASRRPLAQGKFTTCPRKIESGSKRHAGKGVQRK